MSRRARLVSLIKRFCRAATERVSQVSPLPWDEFAYKEESA